MRKDYDFSKAQKKPHASRLKRQVTIRADEGTIASFKELSQDIGMPYQMLINMYLRDCAATRIKLSLQWKTARDCSSFTPLWCPDIARKG